MIFVIYATLFVNTARNVNHNGKSLVKYRDRYLTRLFRASVFSPGSFPKSDWYELAQNDAKWREVEISDT